ncbi:hypothetical protein [Burkholderia lata]|nr:hypothetical protein [Burkholderia lata]
MWRNAASPLPIGGPARSAPGKAAIVETPADASGIAEHQLAATTAPQSAKTAETAATGPRPAAPATQSGTSTVQGQRVYAARIANACPAPGPVPPLERAGLPGTRATGPTERAADAARSRPVPAAYASPPPAAAPFRVTLLPGDGAPFVSLRVAQAGPDDLDTLDSHVRAALQQSGFRASKLVINGVDRNAPGETTHGD